MSWPSSGLVAGGSDLADDDSGLVVVDTVLLDVEVAFLVAAVPVLVIASAALDSGLGAPVGSREETAALSFASPATSEGNAWACDLAASLGVIVSLPEKTNEFDANKLIATQKE